MARDKKKIAIVVLFIVLIAAFFMLDLQRYLSFQFLKDQRSTFEAYFKEQPLLTAIVFFAMYVSVTALSLPGAAIMTLAAGAIFGLLYGTILVSFASTLGASLAFLVSRYLLRETFQEKFSDKLSEINRGVETEGAMYLFTLRLIPAVPFFVINAVMGLTPMKVSTFFLVSQVGMFPGTLVYINAGTQLAQLESAAGILSPGLILSFVLLGLFPLLAKKLISIVKGSKGVVEKV